MRKLILNPMFVACFCLGALNVPSSEAGMLGDMWDSVVGFFTGKKKLDAQAEAQMRSALENTNESQNNVIALVNEVVTYQSGLKDLKDEKARKTLDEMIARMQGSVESNNDSFLKLMQIRKSLHENDLGQDYEANFQPYLEKQNEIESYYQKIEDRYQELQAFAAESDSSSNEQGTEASKDSTWNSAGGRTAIDQWLAENNRDEWGGPKVEGSVIGRPQAAGNRDRYQYLYESYPEVRAFVQAGVLDSKVAQSSTPLPIKGDEPMAEPVSGSGVFVPEAAKKTDLGMAFENRYDHAALREERKKIYKELVDLNVQGKMDSEEYKDLYSEYTRLGDKLKRAP
jgi:hypothetical protein